MHKFQKHLLDQYKLFLGSFSLKILLVGLVDFGFYQSRCNVEVDVYLYKLGSKMDRVRFLEPIALFLWVSIPTHLYLRDLTPHKTSPIRTGCIL